MDFDLPREITDYLDVLDAFIEREIKPLEADRTTTSGSSTIAAKARAPTGRTAACRARNGKRCCARRSGAPTRRATTAYALPQGVRRQGRLQPRDGGDPRAPRSERVSACTTICRTSTRSSAISRSCSCCDDLRHATSRRTTSFPACSTAETSIAFGSDRARAWLRRDPHGDARRPRAATASRAGGSTARRCGPPACIIATHCMLICTHLAATPATRTASRASSCPCRRAGLEDRRVSCGPSTCRPTTRGSRSPTCGCRTTRSSANRTTGLAARPVLRAREPDPPGRVVAGRRACSASRRA